MQLLESNKGEFKEAWQRPWGKKKSAVNHYRQLSVTLSQSNALKRQLILDFRAFNDGIGFRYRLPEQVNLKKFEIIAEKTEFSFTDNPTSWWIPQDFDSYELLYKQTPLSEVEAANTPITIQLDNNTFISIHEDALGNYAGMTRHKDIQKNTLVSELAPWPDGIKVEG